MGSDGDECGGAKQADVQVVAVARDIAEATALATRLRTVLAHAQRHGVWHLHRPVKLTFSSEAWPGSKDGAVRDPRAVRRRLLVSACLNEPDTIQLLEAGVTAVIDARAPAWLLGHAIDEVAEHGVFLDPFVAPALVELVRPNRVGVVGLTRQQHRVLLALAAGSSTGDIAKRIGLHPTTVNAHVRRMRRLLNARTRPELVRAARARGLLLVAPVASARRATAFLSAEVSSQEAPRTPPVVRVTVIDEDRLSREAMLPALRSMGLDVMQHADHPREVTSGAGWDVTLVSVHATSSDSTTLLHRTRLAAPEAALVARLSDAAPTAILAALGSVAQGVVTPAAGITTLAAAVRVAAGGAVYLDAAAATTVIEAVTGAQGGGSGPARARGLSAQERRVLQALAAGERNREVAARLHVAEATVKSHVRQILRKLGVTSREAAVERARQEGLLASHAGTLQHRNRDR